MRYEFLPVRLLNSAHDLTNIGVREFAWEFSVALEVLRVAVLCGYLILGGDVYRLNRTTGLASSTGDSWYADQNTLSVGVIESAGVAERYIRMYHDRNGDGFIFSFVF